MSVHIESPLGFTADFPEHTQVLEDSAAGPNTEQYGLLGGVLLTVIKDDTSVTGAAQANGWAHLMSGFYLEDRARTVLTEGELNIPGKSSYAVVVGSTDPAGEARVAATVGVCPEIEPRLGMLTEIVASTSVS